MADPYSQAVRQFAAKLPSVWRPEERIRVARQNVIGNAQYEVTNGMSEFAMDAMPRSFRGDQMPMPTNTAAMPTPLHDNQLGNYYRTGTRHTGGRAADQIPTAQQVVAYVQSCLRGLQGDEEQEAELLQGLADVLDIYFNNGEAVSGSSLRLPIGQSTSAGQLTAPEQSSNGTFGPRDENWSGIHNPPSSTNHLRGPLGPARNGRDRKPAMDSARRAQRLGDFLDRFPMAKHISVW